MPMGLSVVCLFLFGFVWAESSDGSVPSSQLWCQDEEGRAVDWFVVYKFPEINEYRIRGKTSRRIFLRGVGYMYITNNTVHKGWQVSKKSVRKKSNVLARTISNLYTANENEMWLAYNNQPPRRMTRSRRIYRHYKHSRRAAVGRRQYSTYGAKDGQIYGNTKGVVGANSLGGFWLVHSIPYFPSLHRYRYPKNELETGQSAMCVSLPASELDKVGIAFAYNRPHFFKSEFGGLKHVYPILEKVVTGNLRTYGHQQIPLNSSGSVPFEAFAKCPNFGEDLYEWVASSLDTNLHAETWRKGNKTLPASCDYKRKVTNVEQLGYGPRNVWWYSLRDHSKWAISESSRKPFVCVGDINRTAPQKRRGGGTLCLSDIDLWRAYEGLIRDRDFCPRKARQRNGRRNEPINIRTTGVTIWSEKTLLELWDV